MKTENKCEDNGFKHLWIEKERELSELLQIAFHEGVNARVYKQFKCENCGLVKEALVSFRYSDGKERHEA